MITNPHFKAYYQDNTLLVQFVIEEFVTTFQLATQLKKITDECLESKQKLEKSLAPLFHALNLLLGNESPPFSLWTKGPLTKLKEYCEQFHRNAPGENDLSKKLHSYVYKAWLSAMRNWEIIHSLQMSTPLKDKKDHLAAVKRTISHFHRRLNEMTKFIPRIVNAYSYHENVLFFLLRKKESLTEIYGPGFLNKLLDLGKEIDLVQRYKERGFERLLPLIRNEV